MENRSSVETSPCPAEVDGETGLAQAVLHGGSRRDPFFPDKTSHAVPIFCNADQATVLDALPAPAALLDSQGVITLVNQAWQQSTDSNPLHSAGHKVGLNYLTVCKGAHGNDSAQARRVAAGVRSVLSGATKDFSIEYRCDSAVDQRWYHMTVTLLSDDIPSGALVMQVDISERKRTEEALEASSKRAERRERILSNMLSSSNDLIYSMDRDGRIVFANQPLLDLWGTTLAAATGKNFHDLGYPPELAEQLQRQVQVVFETRKSLTSETLHVGPAGLTVSCEAILSPAFAADGSVDSVIGNARDIAARKRTEETARISEPHLRCPIDGLDPSRFVGLLTPQGTLTEAGQASSARVVPKRKPAEPAPHDSAVDFRTLAESMSQIVWITRADGWNVYFNPRWMDYTGMTLDESLGHGWNKPFHPDDQQRAWDAWQQAVTTRGTYSLECRLRRADGAYRWWLVQGAPLLDADGTILKWFGTCTDIHDLKQAELSLAEANRALSESEQRYRVLFEQSPDPIYLLDRDGRIMDANAAYKELTGYGPPQAGLASNFMSTVAPEHEAVTWAHFGRALQGEQVRYESVRVNKNGQRINVDVRYQLIQVQGAKAGVVERVYAIVKDITDRKRAEEALRKQQEFLAVIIESIDDGIVACNADGVITLRNQAMRELHGLPAGPVSSEPWAEDFVFYQPDGRTPMTPEQMPLFRALHDGSVHMAEMMIVPRQGRARRVVANGQATYDAAACRTGAVVVLRDITDEHRSEESIRQQAHMLDSIGQAVIATDLDGKITYANRFAEDLYGWPIAEIIARNIFDVTIPPSARSRAERGLAKIRKGESWSGEFIGRRRGSLDFHAFATNTPMRDRDGAVVGIVGVSEDISKRKQAEAALRQQHAMLSNAQRVGGMGFWELDVLHNHLVWSEETYQLFGIAAEDFGHTFDAFFAFVHPDDAKWMKPVFANPVPDSSVLELEYRICRPDGQQRVMFERGELVRDAKGRLLRKIGVVMDITERKRDQDALRELNAQLEGRVQERTAELSRAREEAEQANSAKSSFLAAMSHEIRTPMNGVIGMLDVLHQTSLRGDQVEMVDLIRDSAFSLLGIIDDILDFSKMEAGKMILLNEPFELGEVIEKGCAMLTQVAVKRGVHVNLFVDPAIPYTVCGDEGRLRQVLVNLVGNAIKFSSGSEPAGRVSVRALLVERQAAHVVVDLVVADNGIGMSEAALARLFRPFSQADASTTRRFGGTGLGLAITHMLVELMNGQISVCSTPGQGSTFAVRLRFGKLEALTVRNAEPRHVEGLRCRIVGGEQPLAGDLAAYLQDAGAVVERAQDLAAAAAATHAAGLTLWLILPSQPIPPLAELRAMAPAEPSTDTRFVVFRHAALHKPCIDESDLVTINADALARRTLFAALAASRTPRKAGDRQRDPTVLPATVPQSAQAPQPGALILVAEDNETNRVVILRQLQMMGFGAEVCVNGREALERWRSGRFAMVLTDLHMPEMDGYELAAAIRREEDPQHRTPIIALTANALRDEEMRCIAAGMDMYLTKPVRVPRLKAAIESWLDHGTRGDALQDCERASVDILPPVDLSVLEGLVGDDPDLVDEVLQAFHQSASQCSIEFSQAIGQGSMSTVADAAHKLKSAARSIGSSRLGQICSDIEDAAHARRADQLDALVGQFRTELRAVLGFISAR